MIGTTGTCPCGAPLELEAERAHHICNRCRVEAHKPRRRRAPKSDFEDVALPGWDEATQTWGDVG